MIGDGTVTCLPTPGHQSLRVRLAEREIVLAADCAYFTTTLDGGPLPPLGHDHVAHATSLARLRSVAAAGSTVIPGHDGQSMAALPHRLE